jgi:flagellar basal body P-ring formation protein FlgA
MTIAIMLRTTTLAALVALTSPAIAQVTGSLPPTIPTLRRVATVTSDVVRIGDLVDDAGTSANVPIFRSPDIGTTGTVAAIQVLQALRSHDLSDVKTNGIEAIEVTRPGRAVTKKDIEARVVRSLGAQFRSAEAKNIAVFFDRDVQPIYVEPSVTADLQVTNAYFDARSGRFDITLEIPGSALTRRASLHYSGTMMEMAEAAVLTRSLARGELVRNSDIMLVRKPKSDLKNDAIDTLDHLVGMEARTAIPAGQPLRQADLIKPERIKRDESITLIYEVPGILLTCRGKALESGADGDVISVLNVQSKRTVQGTVTGPGRVTIAVTTAQIATNTSSTTASQ